MSTHVRSSICLGNSFTMKRVIIWFKVYEGSTSEGRLVRKLCGNLLPLPEVFSSGRSFLHLHVYGGSLNEGFEGAYSHGEYLKYP